MQDSSHSYAATCSLIVYVKHACKDIARHCHAVNVQQSGNRAVCNCDEYIAYKHSLPLQLGAAMLEMPVIVKPSPPKANKMKILLQQEVGPSFRLTVFGTWRVFWLKKLVRAKTGDLGLNQKELLFENMPMSEYNQLSKYGLRQGSTIKLQNACGMQIFCKILDGRTRTLVLKSSCTIRHIKSILHAREGFDTAILPRMRLVYGGRRLEDQRTLGCYNITEESTLHLLLKLAGD